MEREYMTREGYEKLKKELDELKKKRKEIAKALEHARELGDLSESGEWESAKHAFALNERRIHEISERLAKAEIMDTSKISKDEVRLGARVHLLDEGSGQRIDYTIVGAAEAEPERGRISVKSPVGRALLGKREGEVVDIKTPGGLLKYRIERISYS